MHTSVPRADYDGCTFDFNSMQAHKTSVWHRLLPIIHNCRCEIRFDPCCKATSRQQLTPLQTMKYSATELVRRLSGVLWRSKQKQSTADPKSSNWWHRAINRITILILRNRMMVQQYKKEMWRCMFQFLKTCDEISDFHGLAEHITQRPILVTVILATLSLSKITVIYFKIGHP